MPNKSPRIFSREFKLEAVRRILAGERIRALSQELKVLRKDLYAWRDAVPRGRGGGAAATGSTAQGRWRCSGESEERAREVAAGDIGAPERVAELERKIGQQQIELDFFRQALRRVKEARRPNAGPGVTGSTRSSKR